MGKYTKEMGEYTKEMYDAYRKEQDEKAAKEAEEQRERAEKASARLVWMADGGSEADFEKEWSRLKDEGRRSRVVDADRPPRWWRKARGLWASARRRGISRQREV
jgi:hypothetical protein